jgi:hypothetical protein
MAENKRIQELVDGGLAADGDFFPIARLNPDTDEWEDKKVQLPDFGNRMGTFFYQAPTNLTITLIASARYAFSINGLYGLKTALGTLNLTIQINGVTVAGMSSIAVTSASQNVSAPATVEIGDRVTAIISGATNATGLEFTMF